MSQTSPALDLTVLFNGFKPLFQALSPGRRQPALLRDHPGLPGRGRHARGAARPHRVGDLDAGRPRPGDRQPDRQPQRRCSTTSATATTSSTDADHDVPAASSAASRHDREAILGSLDQISQLSVQTADLVSGHPHSRSSATSTSCAAVAANLDQQQGRARPRPAGAADQAEQGRPHRHLRLVVQLLPLRLPRPGPAARHREASIPSTTRPDRTGATSDEPPHDIARCAPDPAGTPE